MLAAGRRMQLAKAGDILLTAFRGVGLQGLDERLDLRAGNRRGGLPQQ
jgi:hypothetical protein